ncbi:MAG: sulfurtransferase TusA family protein [Gammaproteobacteria bacterium]|jgi:tRNA 2-thiouridine synthesizing protein A|nr:sulfurtransferase TusA family protein [Gammaproteobacteria bacterium]
MADQTLDARGLNCPLPVLRAKQALLGMTPGDTLEVLATDPGSVADFAAFCRVTGHALLESACTDGDYRYRIQKSVTR